MNTLTLQLIDLLWPKHDRTSCSDKNLSNAAPHYDGGIPRCSRCMALDNAGDPLDLFEIRATIRELPDPILIREQALSKLTPAEKRALELPRINLHDVVRIRETGRLATVVNIHRDRYAVEPHDSCEIEDYSFSELDLIIDVKTTP